METGYVKIRRIKEERRERIETDTQYIVNMKALHQDFFHDILRIKGKITKELILCFTYPTNKLETLGISYSAWCKENGITCWTSKKFESMGNSHDILKHGKLP